MNDLRLNHVCLLWNPLTFEWYCRDCGRTSDHQIIDDARTEIEQFPCSPHGVVTEQY